MANYRQMRRRSRQIRRAGMQPMMVINADSGQFPEPAAIVLARWAWRYRSELAPLAVMAALFGAGWWAHAAVPRWWALILAGASAGAWLAVTFGGRLGLPTLAERICAASAVFAAGGWLAVAAALGPLASPLPVALGIGGVLLSVPWWAHGRRRAKVRVERKLAAWPVIARDIGLAGSEVMSAMVDVWGWRARFRLARGQTITDVTERIPKIESGLGTFRNAVRVYPTPDDLANRFELRVLNSDPHADAIPWPGPSVTSITEPVDLGPFEDAEQCRVLFLRRHAIFAGTTGSGKSGGLNVLMANLSACRDVVIWAIDLKKGIELKPWQACIDRLATTPEQAAALLRDAVAILEGRAEYLTEAGRREWEPSTEMPALVVIIDEYAELKEKAPGTMRDTDTIARIGRALAVTLIAATQRPTQKVMGDGAVRSQMDVRICFRVRERRDVDLVLGQGMLNAGWNAHKLNAPGKFLISAPEHDIPKRARAYLVTDQAVSETSERHAGLRPGLDDISRQAILDGNRRIPESGNIPGAERDTDRTQDALWIALCAAPDEGWDIGALINFTGMSRATIYRHLREHISQGRVIQVGRGRWRARTTPEPSP
jgi:FtsK/SpoIIIE family